MKFRLIWAVCLGLLASPVQGLELYRLLDGDCRGPAGLIVYADQEQVELLGLDGRLQSVDRASVRHILVYNSLENPIPEIHLEGRLAENLREIRLKHQGSPTFSGWPIRFEEELVVYYDTQGKTSLVAIDQIVSIQRPEGMAGDLKPQNFLPVSLALGPGLPQCQDRETGATKERLFPTRVIGNQIGISQFFGAYQQGFDRLRRFQERTQFYARPFVYDEETKFGFPLQTPKGNEEYPAFFPFYFQWSAGRPYSHQGLTVLGTKLVAWLPQVEPVFVMQTDLKSHFFNASFVGNPMALAAGSDTLVANRAFALDYYKKMVSKEAALVESFNYLALSGIDYGPWSVAGGVYYPIYGLNGGGLFREFLATQATPIFRVMFQRSKSSVKLIWAQTQVESSDPKATEIRLNGSEAMVSANLALAEESQLRDQLTHYKLKAGFVRTNYEYQWDKEITLGTALVYQPVDYQETYRNSDRSLKGHQTKTLFFGRQSFGSSVVLQGQLNLFFRDYKLGFGAPGSFTDNQYSLVGSIEFIL
ncbi:MAG: hypothetical protein A2600_05465 [Candidatus Lambdaproteobacteria bacterium RIFOXYD1_FULL_56_27]|uniref:Uncharacterized protein n=1 Tax=Candidatus Lambdaproteobacteria bacterium RIFOXYD2_FULL_56_26 TaxID=1817773 RepID=A0A1F6GRE8_9PROT|nr:MAG: hypothetical protein A2426_10675 [Candidatus Lambdaproteobacteria bacterium RIFOXYC1_FULL_56_13]OGH00650.1 MAG: hypothetical protein A2557_03170 [Candidatus Lambdaproteobacteria bacterium RIFOXYD2_FULL_56_26]OGH07816.1 MAG: hypothetical protein A2600_05465 [Candidatus Lambdaproteobacteria bacterium RIFOXYD1_FULL_56_27]